jgi:hypothetical protein
MEATELTDDRQPACDITFLEYACERRTLKSRRILLRGHGRRAYNWLTVSWDELLYDDGYGV